MAETDTETEPEPERWNYGDRRQYEFKVKTVKWFGILCAGVLILMIVAGYAYFSEVLERAQPPEPYLNVQTLFESERLPAHVDYVRLGIELDALKLRNARSVAALIMRSYVEFLAVVLGSALSLIGAVFILARVDDAGTEMQAEGTGFKGASWKAMISGSSPGLFLALFGAILIGYVVSEQREIRTSDTPIFRAVAVPRSAPDPKARDEDLRALREKYPE